MPRQSLPYARPKADDFHYQRQRAFRRSRVHSHLLNFLKIPQRSPLLRSPVRYTIKKPILRGSLERGSRGSSWKVSVHRRGIVGEEARKRTSVRCSVALLFSAPGQCRTVLHWRWTFFFSRGFFLILIGLFPRDTLRTSFHSLVTELHQHNEGTLRCSSSTL